MIVLIVKIECRNPEIEKEVMMRIEREIRDVRRNGLEGPGVYGRKNEHLYIGEEGIEVMRIV